MRTILNKTLNRKAIEFGESLMPNDCIEIMESVIGNRINKLKYTTIVNHVSDMMSTATDVNCSCEIYEAVNNWMNS